MKTTFNRIRFFLPIIIAVALAVTARDQLHAERSKCTGLEADCIVYGCKLVQGVYDTCVWADIKRYTGGGAADTKDAIPEEEHGECGYYLWGDEVDGDCVRNMNTGCGGVAAYPICNPPIGPEGA